MELRRRTVTDYAQASNPKRYWGLCVSFPAFEKQKDQDDPRKTFSNQNLRDISLNGIPIAYQHGTKKPLKHSKVGKVTHTFNGVAGDLRNLFYVDTSTLQGTYVKKAIELNHANEVSLGFEHSLSLEGEQFRVSKEPLELSIVEKGKQDNTKVLWFCAEDRLVAGLGKRPDIHPLFYENITDLESAMRHNTEPSLAGGSSSRLQLNMAETTPTPVPVPTETGLDFTQATNDQLQDKLGTLLKERNELGQQMAEMKTQMETWNTAKKAEEEKEREEYLKNFKQNQETLMDFAAENPNAVQTKEAFAKFTQHATDTMNNEQLNDINMALAGIACNATDVLAENKTLKDEVEKLRQFQAREKARINNQLAQQWTQSHTNPLSRFQFSASEAETLTESAPPAEQMPPATGEKRTAEEAGVETNAQPQRQKVVHSKPMTLMDMVSPQNRGTMEAILSGNTQPPMHLRQGMYKLDGE